MKQRLLFVILSMVALSVTAILASAAQVSPQGPIDAQPGQTAGNAQPQAPAAPTGLLFSYQGQLLNASGNPITNPAAPMIFRLFTTPSGGTACWSESRTVDVRNGVFSVLLGQMTAINSACLTGDAYLELVVGGETLTPRERLTSVAHAVEAGTLSAGAVTRGGISLGGPIDMRHDAIVNVRSLSAPTDAHLDIMYGQNQDMFIKSGASGYVYVGMGGNVHLGVSGVVRTGNVLGSGNQQIHMPGGDDMYINWHSGRSVHFGGGDQQADVSITPTGMVTYGPMTVNGNTTINGNLHLNGSCSLSAASGSSEGANALVTNNNEDCTAGSITSGAYIEANLQTPEERRSERVDRFERGDLLCWSAEEDQLELCATANDRLVMAVADPNGRPIVIGAEPVKVLGPVQAGDILVSSDVPGYAMVNNDPKPGTVIGQALESFDGARALIKAMVRKW